MSSLFRSGFETNNFTATEWTSVAGGTSIVTSPVHSGTYAGQIAVPNDTSTNEIRKDLSSVTSGTFLVRWYTSFDAAPSTQMRIWRNASNGGTSGVVLLLNTDRTLSVADLTGTVGPGSTVLSLNTMYRIELSVTLHDTTGSWELRINGVTELSATNRDTLPTSVVQWTWGRGSVGAGQGAVTLIIDDVAINDTNGSFQTSWPGDGKIYLLEPNTEVSTTWTPSTGTDNSANVDDLPGTPDDDTTYNSSATANDEDRLGLTDLGAEVPSNATMKVIHVNARVRGEGTTGTRQMRYLLWDEGGSQTVGATNNNNDNTAYGIDLQDEGLVYDATGKTKTNIDSFDIGYEPVTAHATRVSAIWANVEWIESGAQTVTANQASETNTSQALTSKKTTALSQALSTEVAQAVARIKAVAIAQVIESDLAQAIAWSPKYRFVAQVSETNAAQTISANAAKVIAVTQVAESDLAQAITALQNPIIRAITQVNEVDSAGVVTAVGGEVAAPAGTVPIRYVSEGPNVVPVQTVGAGGIDIVPCREVAGPANVVPVYEAADTKNNRVKVVLV